MKFIAFLISVGRSFFDAFVFMTLWGWFVVPLGVVRLTFWHAYGLDLCIGFTFFGLVRAIMAYGEKVEQDGEAAITSAVMWWIATGLTLAVGALIHRGVPA